MIFHRILQSLTHGRSRGCRALVVSAILLPASAGCFKEQSIQIRDNERVTLPPEIVSPTEHFTVRDWAVHAHEHFAATLPGGSDLTLLTADMVDAEHNAIDVFAHFGINPETLHSLVGNLNGLRYTAAAACARFYIDERPPVWPGFEDVEIPIHDALSLSARFGLAMIGDTPRHADCIVLLGGFYADNGVQRTRDLALALRDAGYHVLAVEQRGCGQTEVSHPDIGYSFGALDMDDMLIVSDWLTAHQFIQRTGLVGFCWGGNVALLTAWYDGRVGPEQSLTPALMKFLREPQPERRRYEAGIIAFSPVLRWETLRDQLETRWEQLDNPILHGVQETIRERKAFKNFADQSGSLRELIECEYRLYGDPMPGGAAECFSAIRLLPYNGEPDYDKFEKARMPVLIVHGANDPLVPAQDVADAVAQTDNPNVAAIILPSGGHVGFAAWARAYYFNLVLEFFNPQVGAATHVSQLHANESATATQD